MPRIALLLLLTIVLGATTFVTSASAHSGKVRKACADSGAPILCAVNFYRDGTWQYQDGLGQQRTRSVYSDRRSGSEAYREWVRDLWHDRYHDARKAWESRPTFLDWPEWTALAMCETGGNWSAQGPTYEGGLGMHYQVWDQYRNGQFAENAGDASREEQIIVAYRLYQVYGWEPWGCAQHALGWT